MNPSFGLAHGLFCPLFECCTRVALTSGNVLFCFPFFLLLPIGRNCQKPINYNHQSETITVSCTQIEIFWATYEEEALKRLTDILDSPITTEDVNTFAVEAITSVNENEIIKKWQEQLMILMPVVEQHHMVPFHHRFLNTQLKEEENIQQMKERLITRAESSNHWLNELVQELAYSPDTEDLNNIQTMPDDSLTLEYNFSMI